MLSNMKTLFGIVLLLAGFVYYLVSQDNTDDSVGKEAWLLPQLQGEVTGQLTEINVSKNSESISLVKNGETWFVKGGFYADTAPMMQLLQALRSAEKIEAKTSNPENFKLLEVNNDDLKVTLLAGEETIASVYLGKKASTPGASFARLAGDDQTWLVTASDQVAFMSDDWALKTIIDQNADGVVQVRIDNGTDDVLEINRELETGSWQLANIPEGKQVKADSSLLPLASGLSSFTIDAATPVDIADKALKVSADYQLTTGESIAVKVYQHAADYYVTMDRKKYQDWMFKVPSYKFDALNKSMSEFLEDATVAEVKEESAVIEGTDAK